MIFTYIFIGGLSVTVSYFLMIYLKYSWLCDKEYDPWGNSNSQFHVGADTLNLLFLHYFFYIYIFFHVYYRIRFDKAIYLSLLFKFILSARLSNTLWRLNVLLFSEFINIVSVFVLSLYWIHYIVIYCFSNFFCLMQRIYYLMNFF